MDRYFSPSLLVRAHESVNFLLVCRRSVASQCRFPLPRRCWDLPLLWLSAGLGRDNRMGSLGLHDAPIEASRSAVVIPVIAMVIVVAMSPNLRTSRRKGFYLDAMSLTPGMTVSSVRQRMNGYEVFNKYEGAMVFRCKSNDSTVDTVSVTTSNDGLYVLSVEYSPD